MPRITPKPREEPSELEDVFERAEKALGFVPNTVSDEDFVELKKHFDDDQILAKKTLASSGWAVCKHTS